MLGILGAAALVIIVIVFMKTVKVSEVDAGDPVEAAASAAAREKIYGTQRLQRQAKFDAAQRPRVEKLWARVRDKIHTVAEVARAKGIDVTESEFGVQFDGASESLVVQVDASETDPEFLMWIEEQETGESSGLNRVRQIRVMMERLTEWIDSH